MIIKRGTNGADTLRGTAGADTLYGFGGNDTLRGSTGGDALWSSLGHDRMFGEGGNDDLRGEDGDDTLDGGTGDDFAIGGNGRDLLYGGDGNDHLITGLSGAGSTDNAVDRAFGGAGDDNLNGLDRSADLLIGDAGNDYLSVNNDDAQGGSGFDVFEVRFGGKLAGGADADIFRIYNEQADAVSRTVITDFGGGDDVWLHCDVGAGAGLFARLDRDGDDRLTGRDGFGVTQGTTIGVSQTASGLTIHLGEDSVRFDHVASIGAADWA